MSKGVGQKIVLQFSEILVGDVTGIFPRPLDAPKYIKPTGIASHSTAYSIYYASNCFDTSTSSYWSTRTVGSQWIQICVYEPIPIKGFRWYISGSHRPNSFIFQGSNDDVNWTDLYVGDSPNTTGWVEVEIPSIVTYKCYRWTITSRHSSYIIINEIQMLKASGNELAFEVVGLEKNSVLLDPITHIYAVDTVQRHPTILDNKTLILTMHPQGRFNNTEEILYISYDASIGTLQGRGGFIEEFNVQFVPNDLISFPNPHVQETISGNIDGHVSLIKANYNNRYNTESITTAIDAQITFIYVGTVNP